MTRTGSGAAIAVAALTIVSFAQQSLPQGEDTAPSPETMRRTAAARAFARTFAAEGTEEFSRAFRAAVDVAYSLDMPSMPVARSLRDPLSGGVDRDSRFRDPLSGGVDRDSRFRDQQKAMLDQPDQRIWGGEEVPPGQFEDTVAITGPGGLCTGTLIAPNAVLTAAHCQCGGANQVVIFGRDIRGIDTQRVEVDHGVSMIGCQQPLGNGDLAVLVLRRAVSVKPRIVAAGKAVDNAGSLRAVGFGQTENASSGIKRMVDVPVATATCTGAVHTGSGDTSDSVYYGCTPELEMVAGSARLNKDTCFGDSGGPVFVKGADRNYYLAASTSRGIAARGSRPCGDGGIYTRVGARALDWLKTAGVGVTLQP